MEILTMCLHCGVQEERGEVAKSFGLLPGLPLPLSIPFFCIANMPSN